MSQKLEALQQYLEKMNRFNHVATLLYWDMRTGVPKEGYERHADAAAYFSTEAFQMGVSEELGGLLEALSAPEEYEELNDKWKFIVKKMKSEFDRDKRIPAEVYERYVRAQAESERAWEEAKNSSDYTLFSPHLEKMIALTKEITAYTDPDKDVYDALLNQYEEGMDSETIDRIFEDLKKELVPLVARILEAEEPDDRKFCGKFDVDAQVKVQKMLLDYIGFSWEKGAVATTEHPFTLNFSSKDVRVTNHYYEDMPLSAMFSAIHEGGHAIFEQNVNPEYDGTIAGSCRFMGLHESQSRFYENVLGRNKNFWIPIYEKLGEFLPQFQEISLEEFYREINHVRNSFIRTEADELTYAFHIIIRYEIEKAIFREGVSVEALPALWNKKMQEYLKITPKNDAEGILQDTHWSGGMFGYFPSYLLGTVYDGMYLEQLEKELGPVENLLAEGRILEITGWLNEKIHRFGSTRTPKETLLAVCGREVTAEPVIRYFKEKYTEVYQLAKQGIIFDMDGTLWDSAENVAVSWNIAIKESGLIERELSAADIQGVMGKTMDKIADALFPELKKEDRMKLLEDCCKLENAYLREHGGRLYPKLEETLQALCTRYSLYIVSNCQAGYIEAFLDHYGFWKYFKDMECYGNHFRQKGENIRLLADRNGLGKAVYVGDIQGDYDASRQAGVGFIHAAYGFGTINTEVLRIKSVEELQQAAERYFEC